MLERVLVAYLKALVCTRRGGAEGWYELRTFLAQKEPARRKVRGAGGKTRGERAISLCSVLIPPTHAPSHPGACCVIHCGPHVER